MSLGRRTALARLAWHNRCRRLHRLFGRLLRCGTHFRRNDADTFEGNRRRRGGPHDTAPFHCVAIRATHVVFDGLDRLGLVTIIVLFDIEILTVQVFQDALRRGIVKRLFDITHLGQFDFLDIRRTRHIDIGRRCTRITKTKSLAQVVRNDRRQSGQAHIQVSRVCNGNQILNQKLAVTRLATDDVNVHFAASIILYADQKGLQFVRGIVNRDKDKVLRPIV